MNGNILDTAGSTVINKAKGRISKRVLQENKARQIFQKINISYPLNAQLRVRIRGKKCSFFRKFGALFFSCSTHFEIRLLPYY